MGLFWFVLMLLVYVGLRLLIAIVEHGGGPWGFCIGLLFTFMQCGRSVCLCAIYGTGIWKAD